MIATLLFQAVAGASVVLVGLAAVHLHCYPPKRGHIDRITMEPRSAATWSEAT